MKKLIFAMGRLVQSAPTQWSCWLALAGLLLAPALSYATNPSYTWTSTTGGSSITDGTGSWDTSHADWLLNGSGTAVNWGNSPVWNATIGNGGAGGTITAGTITVGNITFPTVTSPYTVSGGTITLSGTPTIAVNNSGGVTIGSVLSGSFAVSASSAANTLILSASETSTATITVNSGILDMKGNAAPALPDATAITVNSGGTFLADWANSPGSTVGYTATVNSGGTLTIQSGATSSFLGGKSGALLTLAGGTVDEATTGKTPGVAVNVSADSTLGSAANPNSLNWSGTWTLQNATRQLTINAPMTISGAIGDGSHGYGLTKAGSATLTLSTANTYSGATTIKNGTLIGVVGGSCASSAVSVAATSGNTAVLGVSITDITKQWTCSSLTVNNAGTSSSLDFNFGSLVPSTTLAPLKVTSAAAFTTTPVVTVELPNSGIGGAGTQYPLMTWGSTSGTAPSSVTVTGSHVAAHLTVSGSTLYLVIDSNKEPLTWATSTSGTWDTSTANWKDNSGTATTYSEAVLPGDQVVFADNYITANTTVTLNSTVTPTSVTANNSTYNYTISGSGAIAGSTTALTKSGTGTLTLSDANTYTGGTTINAGTLKEDFNASGAASTIISSSSALTLGGGTLNINGKTGTASSQTFASTALNAGNSIISAAPASGSTLPTLTLNGFTANAGGTVEFTGPATIGSGGSSVSATASITTTASGNSAFVGSSSGAFYATVGLYDFAATTGSSSPYTVVGGSQISGFYTTASGTAGSSGNLDVSGNITAWSAQPYLGSMRFNTSISANISVSETGNGGTLTLPTILVTPNVGAYNVTYSGGSLRPSSGAGTALTVWQNNMLGELILGGTIANSKSANATYVQAGSGTVSITGTSSGYAGQSYLNGGVTLIAGNGSIGAATSYQAINLNGGTLVGNASTITLDNGSSATAHPVVLGNNGGGLAAVSGYTMTVDGAVSGASGTGPLTIGIPASSANGNVAGQVPGTGSGTANTTAVNATGTVVLSGANTYTGGTVLDSGTLQFGASGNLGTGGFTFNGGTLQWSGNTYDISAQTVTINSGGGTLDVNGNTVTLANAIGNSGSGSLTVVNSTPATGSLTLSSAVTYPGGTTIGSGTLKLGVNNTLPTASTVTLGGSSTAGTLDLAGYNQQVGGLAIGSGATASSQIIGNSSTANNSTLTFNSAGSSSFGGIIQNTLGSGNKTVALTVAGGTMTLSGANTYGGATTISKGTLVGVVGGSCANSAVSVAATSGNTAVLGVSITDITKQWTCSSLTVNNGGTSSGLDFNFGSLVPSTTLAPLKVTGAAAFTTSPTMTVEMDGNAAVVGTQYPLMTWGSGSITAPSSITITAPRSITGHLTVSGTTLYLVIDSNKEPLSWTSGGTGIWNTSDAGNWKDNSGTATTYSEADLPGDQVQFTDANISADTTVTLSSTVTPTSVTANNSTYNYTVSGSGIITGNAALTKSGTKTLTLSTANTYSGGTTLNSGTLAITTASALGSGTVNLSAGTLNINQLAPANTLNATGAANVQSDATSTTAIPSVAGLTGSGNLEIDVKTANSKICTMDLTSSTFSLSGTLSIQNVNGPSTTLRINNGSFFGNANVALVLGSNVSLEKRSTQTGTISFGSLSGDSTTSLLGAEGSGNTTATIYSIGGNNASSTTFAGKIQNGAGTLSLIKVGSGTQILSGANTFTGGVNINNGILNVGGTETAGTSGPLGASGTISFGGGTLQYSSADTADYSSRFSTAASQPISIDTAGQSVSFVTALTSSGGTLTKTGAGTLTLSGLNTYSGATTVSAGALTVGTGGAINNGNAANVGQVSVANAATTAGVLNIAGGTVNATYVTAPSLQAGTASGANGAINLSSGTLNAASELWLGSVGTVSQSALGALNVGGGTATIGSYLALGRSTVAGGAARGELTVSSGTLTVSANQLTIGSFNNGAANTSVANLTGGTTTVGTSASAGGSVFAGENANGILTVSGSAALNILNTTAPATLELGVNSGVAGIVNLNGGTITTPSVTQGGSGTGYFNFNGGTLKANKATTSFMGGLTAAYVFGGGAVIDDGGNAITIAQPLLTPTTGSGVSLGTLSVSGSGFVAPPIVDISGTGTGASAIATIDGSGNLTGVTLTSPGVGYTGTPTFTFTGGGGTVTPSGSASSSANTSGGLTKQGLGTMTLTGPSTYTGNTTISAGTLALSGSGSINNSASISIAAGATLDVSAISSYTLSSSTTLNASGAASAATINGASAGTVNLGSQAITLTYDGSHPALTISQGTLQLNGNAFTVNGSTLSSGNYNVVHQTSGNVSASGTFTVTGTAIDSTHYGSIAADNSGNVVLTVAKKPTVAGKTYSRAPGVALKIHASDLAATATVDTFLGYTATFDHCVSTTANSVTLGNNGQTTGNSAILVYPSSAANSGDSFSYTINDGHGGMVSGTVTITINNVTGQATINLAGQTATLGFFGVPGYHYVVQRSVNSLNDWQDLSNVTVTPDGTSVDGSGVITAPSGGAFTVTDPSPPSNPNSVYYQLRSAP